jgi:hypothetical protein
MLEKRQILKMNNEWWLTSVSKPLGKNSMPNAIFYDQVRVGH